MEAIKYNRILEVIILMEKTAIKERPLGLGLK